MRAKRSQGYQAHRRVVCTFYGLSVVPSVPLYIAVHCLDQDNALDAWLDFLLVVVGDSTLRIGQSQLWANAHRWKVTLRRIMRRHPRQLDHL